MDEDDDIFGGSLDEEQVIASFPGLKPSPKTQLRTQLNEASKALVMEHKYIRRLEEALAAHGVDDLEALRSDLVPSALSPSPYLLNGPSIRQHGPNPGPDVLNFPPSSLSSTIEAITHTPERSASTSGAAAMLQHYRSPSQLTRPDYNEIFDTSNCTHPPKLIRSESVFAHATEVRFDDLNYTVQKQATRAGTLTVGAQCLKLWSWPFACLLRRNQQQQQVEIKVLKNLHGVLLPGRLTLLLGPPGSGKSTFLKALSGRVERTRTSVLKGRVTYNGDTAESHRFSLPKVVAFVSQEDCHAPTMTVQETVQFAYDCMNGPPPQVVAPSSPQSSVASNTDLAKRLICEQQQSASASFSSSPSSSSYSFPSSPSSTAASFAASTMKKKTGKVEQTLRVLGLSRCQHTIVGNALLRGISGGEKKRLTTAEMTGGQVNVLLMDSISTGLDSAATFDICKTLSVCTRTLQANIVVCLLQPPPEVFELFDDVILMDGGQIVYQGPREQVLEHFECLGFRCPPRKDVADFLVEVTTPMGSGYSMPASQRYVAGIPDPPRTTDEFVLAFQQTEIYESMVDKMEAPPSFAPWLRRQRHEFSNGWYRSTWLCLQRQIKITARDRVFLRGRVMQVLLMGVMAGTLFYRLDAHDWSDKVCMLFFSLMFIALGNLATIPTVMEQRNVFYKQRDSGFFPTSAAVVAQMLVQIPIQFVETLIFTSLAYFLSGLSRAEHGSYYLTYVLVAFSTALAIGQIFRLVVHMVPSLAQAQPICALCVLLFVVFSGLTIKGEDVPICWTWLYWINPLAWGLRALAINEFSSPTYGTHIIYPPPIPKAVPCDPKWPEDLLKHSFPGGPYQCLTEGEIYLTNLGFKTTREWIVGGILFLVTLWVAMLLLTMLAMHFIRWTGRSMVPLPPAAVSETKGEDGQGKDGRKGRHATAATGAGGDPFSYHVLVDGADEAALSRSSRRHSHTMGASLSFTPVTLVFKHLWYSVELPKPQGGGKERVELVKGVSGYAKPGTMTALMGSSGAGKTTLLDVLAGRKTTGTIIGEILVNGFEKVQRTFSRVCGYVEQQDVHSPHSTVREALIFSATLRLPYTQVTEAQRVSFVEEMLELLELQEIADRVIGEDADSGLLMGERKRVTIGVELVANPSVLFLDEPTTGLDAAKALEVMQAVKKVAASGRSVICTIHQPSCVTFEMFDMLLLLRHGGRTVYFGPLGEQSSHLISYFEAVPGVTSMRPGGVNPANWMLECIGAGIEPAAQAVDFAEFYQDHALARRNEELCETLGQPSALYGQQLSPIAFETRYAAPLKVQLRACMTKAVTNYWRSPNYNVTRCLISCVVGVVFGSVYHDKAYDTETDIIGRTGLMYLSTSFVGIVNMMSVMPVMAKERAAFYREQASSMYSVLAYGISYGLVELPYIFVSTGLFVNVFYWYIGLATDPLSKFVYYWIFFALYIVSMVFIGQFLICLLPNQQTAQVAGASIAATMNLFGGYLCTPKTIPPFWKFVYYLVPSHYMLEGLVMSQFEGDKTPVKPIYGVQATPADQYIYDHFGGEFTYGAKWKDIGVLILYISLLRVGTFLVMKFVRHINR